MNRHQYKDFTIEVIDEPTYINGSEDNNFNYSKTYLADIEGQTPTSKHRILISQQLLLWLHFPLVQPIYYPI